VEVKLNTHNLNIFQYQGSILKENNAFSKNVQKFACSGIPSSGLCLSALFTLKVKNSVISLVGTQIPAVSMMEWQFILPLKNIYDKDHQDVIWN
jgi:hypothetical protein